MKKSKFIDLAVLMAVRTNRSKNQERSVEKLIKNALADKSTLGSAQKKVIKAITVAVLAEGLGAL